MNFDSPSNIMKSIFTHSSLSSSSKANTPPDILIDSPNSPSFLPNHIINRTGKKISRTHQKLSSLSTKNLNFVVETISKDKTSYDSPTTTLAADLGQNFRIQDLKADNITIPTPKRSLKFDSLTGSGLTNKLLDSLSSSKDGFDESDDFEQSPLIKKTIEIQKSTLSGKDNSRATSISSLNTIESTSSMSSLDCDNDKFTFPLPQRQSALRRSKTLFTKNPSTASFNDLILKNNCAFRSRESFLLPGFNDDEDSNDESTNDEENPLDKLCFASPVPSQKKKNLSSQDNLSKTMKREIGSPVQKKDLRAKVRRTHSMFNSKKDISDTTQMLGNLMGSPHSPKFFNDNDCNDSLSNSVLHKSKIKTFKVKNDQLPRIDSTELCRILDGTFKEFFDEVIVVDSRFEYEYNGGHINGAINIPCQEELEKRFLNGNKYPASSCLASTKEIRNSTSPFGTKASHPLIIFHCEYSSYRGPSMALHLRSCDRNLNQDNYPHLDFPDILILEGGYKNFFEKNSARCFPQEYIKMDHENHKDNNERGMNKFRKDFKRASSFNNLTFSSTFQQSRTHSRTLSSRSIQFNSSTNASSGELCFKKTTPFFESNFSSSSDSSNKIKPISLDLIDDDEETEGILPPVNLSFKFPLNPEDIPSLSPSSFSGLLKEEEEEEDQGPEELEGGKIMEKKKKKKKKFLNKSESMKY